MNNPSTEVNDKERMAYEQRIAGLTEYQRLLKFNIYLERKNKFHQIELVAAFLMGMLFLYLYENGGTIWYVPKDRK